MVKRTNRIQNLNKMILDYKREEKKFKIIQDEITNQQKEIENLRLLILSTNFLNSNQSSNSLNQNSMNQNTLNSNQLNQNQLNQNTSNQLNQSSKINSINKNQSIKNDKELDQKIKIKKSIDQSIKSNQKTTNKTKLIDTTPSTNQLKSKGLQTISKNLLNQKDNKYLIDNKNLFTKSKTDNQLIDKSTSSIDLINRLNKIKSTMNLNKLENQENPRELELGLNKISKSIKKTRPIKSNLKSSSTKLTNSNRQLQRL